MDIDIADHIDYIKIADLLNPETNDTPGSSSSNRPPGQTPPDPNDNKPNNKAGVLPNDGYDNRNYRELADYLERTRKAVIEERVSFGSKSKSTTFSELGVSFMERSNLSSNAKMVQTVLGSHILGSSICTEDSIYRIRNYYPK